METPKRVGATTPDRNDQKRTVSKGLGTNVLSVSVSPATNQPQSARRWRSEDVIQECKTRCCTRAGADGKIWVKSQRVGCSGRRAAKGELEGERLEGAEKGSVERVRGTKANEIVKKLANVRTDMRRAQPILVEKVGRREWRRLYVAEAPENF